MNEFISWFEGTRDTIPVSAALIILAGLGAFLGLCVVLQRTDSIQIGRRTIWAGQAILFPLGVMALESIIVKLTGFSASADVPSPILHVFDVAMWGVAAWLVIRALDIFVWGGLVRRQTGVEVPRLLKTISAISIYVITVFGVASFVFNLPITGIAVSSGVVVGVIGLAMQGTLSDFISGVALSMERPYRINDWIELEDGQIGQVVDINWRSTRVKSWHNSIFIIPNAKAAAQIVHNFHLPSPAYGYWFYISLPPEVSPLLARRIMLEAALSSDKVLRDPPPVIRFWDMGKRPFEYMVYVHFADYPTYFLSKDDLLIRIWIHFARAGITPAANAQEMTVFRGKRVDIQEPGPEELIKEIELAKPLNDDERRQLLGSVSVETVGSGETIVREGEEGASLFVVASGVVQVSRTIEKGKTLDIARLGMGECFGEMSLLTGERRGADVSAVTECQILEIQKCGLDPILAARPEIIETLAQVMAERRIKTETLTNGAATQKKSVMLSAYAGEIASKMRSFFKVG
ncbi:MAG: mechanosensitive ion channel family protein [Alphaproteobacteria bacterium]|nr:mechanosensitive ion channel family protein [Alphaproteobacteria bacterium]